jgi:hypothetical protein
MRDLRKERRGAKDRSADDITGDRREARSEKRIKREFTQHDLKPEEQPGQRSNESGSDPPAAPQATMIRSRLSDMRTS